MEKEHDEAFDKIKKLLLSKQCLALHDVSKPVTWQVDACQSGLGAALMQEGKPVAYALRAMTSAQRNYAIIEKELLAVLRGGSRPQGRMSDFMAGKRSVVKQQTSQYL